MAIDTSLTEHARRQAQRRGISLATLELVITQADRSRKLPGRVRCVWISRRGRQRLIRLKYNPSEVDRARGVRLLIALKDDVVVTVEHTTARRCFV